MQKELTSLGVGVRKISLNPSMLTPFLDNRNAEEAALKKLLQSVNKISVFSLPGAQVVDDLALRVKKAGYEQTAALQQQQYRLLAYLLPADGKRTAASLVLLLQKSDEVFYGVEMSGSIDSLVLANLIRVSPAFLDSYIRRFNVKF